MWCSGCYPTNLQLWYFQMMLKIKRRYRFFARITQKHDCDNRNAAYLSCFKDTSIAKRPYLD